MNQVATIYSQDSNPLSPRERGVGDCDRKEMEEGREEEREEGREERKEEEERGDDVWEREAKELYQWTQNLSFDDVL